MYTDTDGELDTFGLLQPLIQVSHSSKNSQTSQYCSLGIVLVSLGIPKIHQESIPEQLGDMSIKACDDLGADLLIRPYHVTVHFGVELTGELRRIYKITEHHGQLATFSFGCTRGPERRCGLDRCCFLGQRRWGRLGRRSRCVDGPFDLAGPHETSTLVISHWVHVEEFCFEGFEILVIQAEPYLKGWVGNSPLAFEESDDLVEDFIEYHGLLLAQTCGA